MHYLTSGALAHPKTSTANWLDDLKEVDEPMATFGMAFRQSGYSASSAHHYLHFHPRSHACSRALTMITIIPRAGMRTGLRACCLLLLCRCSLVSPVAIPGVVGLVALEGLLGFSSPFYPFFPYNQRYHYGKFCKQPRWKGGEEVEEVLLVDYEHNRAEET